MLKVVAERAAGEEPAFGIDEICHEGARRMLAVALEAEVDAYVAEHLEDRRRARSPARRAQRPRQTRTVKTVAGAVEVTAPRVDDKRVDGESGERKDRQLDPAPGAFDYLTKPIAAQKLLLTVDRAIERRTLSGEVTNLRREVGERYAAEGLVAASPGMRRVLELVDVVSATDSAVLIQGESGTGKELVARAIHFRGARAARPFHCHQLRRAPRGAPGKRAVRLRQGRIHRRGHGAKGPVRGCRRGHAPAGRDRGHAAAPPGQAPARAPGRRDPPRGQHVGAPRRREDPGLDEPRPACPDP